MNDANAAAVAAANPRRSIKIPLALLVEVSKPVSSTLPAGIAAFSVADIMPTFARPEAVAADVSVATVAAYSTLGGTTVAIAEAAAADVTVATAASANLAAAEAAAADFSVPVDTAALFSASSVAAEFASAAVVIRLLPLLEMKG